MSELIGSNPDGCSLLAGMVEAGQKDHVVGVYLSLPHQGIKTMADRSIPKKEHIWGNTMYGI
jgi:hypothetical protein